MHFWHMCVLLRTSACTLLYTLSTLMFMPCTHALHDFQSRLLYFSYTAFRLVIRNLEATVVCLLYDCSATGNRILRDLSPGGIPDESQVFQTTASARNRQALGLRVRTVQTAIISHRKKLQFASGLVFL